MNWEAKYQAYLIKHTMLLEVTIRQHLSRVRVFARWLRYHTSVTDSPRQMGRIKSYGTAAAAGDEQIRDYFKHLNDSHRVSGYRQQIKTALRYYYEFLVSEGTIKSAPDLVIPIRKNGGDTDKEERVLTDEHILKFRDHFQGTRDRVMMICLMDLGVRLHELVKIMFGDFDMDLGQVTIHSTKTEGKSKYGGRRIMPLSPALRGAVSVYQDLEPGQYLFPITTGQAWRIVKKVGVDAGMPWLHPHLFRHYCITKFAQATGDDGVSPVFRSKELSMMFGVSPKVITERYYHPSTESIVSKANKSVYSDA